MGQIIQACIPGHKLAGRFGGEEFAIVLPGVDQEQARALAERIRTKIAITGFALTTIPKPICATMSFGIACFPADATTPTHLIYQADVAVYHAKLMGRNRVMCLADLPQAVRFEGIPLESSLSMRTKVDGPMMASPQLDSYAATLPLAVPQGMATMPTPQTAPPPLPTASLKSRLFMGGVIATGSLVASFGFSHNGLLDWTTTGLLMMMAVLAELLPVDLYRVGTISASVAIAFAAALLVGIPVLQWSVLRLRSQRPLSMRASRWCG